jgi:hypothetical protein
MLYLYPHNMTTGTTATHDHTSVLPEFCLPTFNIVDAYGDIKKFSFKTFQM